MKVPQIRHIRTSAATIGNFMIKKELALYLDEAGIEIDALLNVLVSFMTTSSTFTDKHSDIDSMLFYLQKESIQDFVKLLTPDAPKIVLELSVED
jgi:hypothetical protein